MADLDSVDVGRLAHAAGFTTFDQLWEAIAYARLASANNPIKIDMGTDRVGLWQIKSDRAQEGKGTDRDGLKLLDPAFNAGAIFRITNGGKNWNELYWLGLRKHLIAVETKAAARVVLGTADAVDKAIAGSGSVVDKATDAAGKAADAATATAGGIADLATAVRAVAGWLGDRNNTIRIGKALIGGALLIGAVYIVARPIVR